MELLNEYFRIKRAIYNLFVSKEAWVVIPLDNSTKYYWWLDQNENGGGCVFFSDEPFSLELIEKGEKLCVGTIYEQRFLPQWVYRKKGYTMICGDTHVDGFMRVFDNNKELIDPSSEFIEAFRKWNLRQLH
jgi:hypothetical protein